MRRFLLFLLLFLSVAVFAQSGPGNGPTQHSSALSWANSGSLTGNCVYRSQTSQTYGKALSCSTAPITAYTDATVVSGQTYYYVITAYVSGPPFEESAFSNEVKTVIPLSPPAPSGLAAVAQ